MATGSFTPYQSFLKNALNGSLKLASDTIAAILLDASYTPNVSTHQFLADISSYEIAQAGYARQNISGLTITNNGGGQTVIDCNDISFGSNVSLSARYLVLVDISPSGAAAQPLLGYVDLNSGGSGNVSSTNSSFAVAINSSGLYAITP